MLLFALARCGSGGATTADAGDASPDVSGGFGFIPVDAQVMSCADVVVDASDPEASASPADANCTVTRSVTFSQDVFPITRGCAGEVRHAWTPSAMVGIAAYECCDGRPIVKAGDPAGSYILDKLSGMHICRGARMPLGGKALSSADMQTIADWICAGALDN